MEMSDLFNGIAIVIDDEIKKGNANINNLIQQIEKRDMPCVTYTTLPDIDSVRHFESVSFILLDWKLQPEDLSDYTLEGLRVPASLSVSDLDANIQFLKKLKETCFVPVFIFTNEEKEFIINKLKENDLYQDDKQNFIFVKNKKDLTGRNRLFRVIEKWVGNTPSIYVLKEWEREYNCAINRLFWDFYQQSPCWPKILWEAFKADEVDMSYELGEVITRNLYTRMSPFSFDDKSITKRGRMASKDEVRKVLEGERYIKSDQLKKDE
ncbi:MAG: hypothetical protein KJ687_03140, partial [Proteobacteria bacterium]|nr:hypothetical protein [Pseudomonadota bacterium]